MVICNTSTKPWQVAIIISMQYGPEIFTSIVSVLILVYREQQPGKRMADLCSLCMDNVDKWKWVLSVLPWFFWTHQIQFGRKQRLEDPLYHISSHVTIYCKSDMRLYSVFINRIFLWFSTISAWKIFLR